MNERAGTIMDFDKQIELWTWKKKKN